MDDHKLALILCTFKLLLTLYCIVPYGRILIIVFPLKKSIAHSQQHSLKTFAPRDWPGAGPRDELTNLRTSGQASFYLVL